MQDRLLYVPKSAVGIQESGWLFCGVTRLLRINVIIINNLIPHHARYLLLYIRSKCYVTQNSLTITIPTQPQISIGF